MNKVEKIYQELRQKYGRPSDQWRLWCRRPKALAEKEEVIIGSVLTQRANWKNAELALNNLAGAKIKNLAAIRRLYQKNKIRLFSLIKPAGFYRQKAEYLCGLAVFFSGERADLRMVQKTPLERLRKDLLAVKGVGPETCDSILLYTLDYPIFVIDEYTRRLARRRRLTAKTAYDALQDFFQKNLRKDFRLYQDFHALIVIDGKNQNHKS